MNVGLVVSWLVVQVARRTNDPLAETALTLLGPYLAWIGAESLHVSAVLACVAGGIYLRQHFSTVVAPASRVQARAVWDLFLFGLNSLVFLLLGAEFGDLMYQRMRAAGAGIGAFFCPTGVGTLLAGDRETREIDGKQYLLENPIKGDFAFIKALKGDRWGNLIYRKTARNFGPVMAMAATTTIVEVDEVVELGALDPEAIFTPGIFVQRVVPVEQGG